MKLSTYYGNFKRIKDGYFIKRKLTSPFEKVEGTPIKIAHLPDLRLFYTTEKTGKTSKEYKLYEETTGLQFGRTCKTSVFKCEGDFREFFRRVIETNSADNLQSLVDFGYYSPAYQHNTIMNKAKYDSTPKEKYNAADAKPLKEILAKPKAEKPKKEIYTPKKADKKPIKQPLTKKVNTPVMAKKKTTEKGYSDCKNQPLFFGRWKNTKDGKASAKARAESVGGKVKLSRSRKYVMVAVAR